MAFDGGFLYKTLGEIREAIDCHIDKIYQPSKDELVFLLRKSGFVKRLLITVKSGVSRMHFTENKFENPEVPPNFCMLLRKHLSAARLVEVNQTGMERVAELVFSASNEMKDIVTLKLICELIGNGSNVVLVKDGRIIDALRRSDVETAQRFILPGAVYEYPPSQNKVNPLDCDAQTVLRDIKNDDFLTKKLLSAFDGFSPLICREIEYKLNSKSLAEGFEEIKNDLEKGKKAYLVLRPDKTPLDFSYTKINQYGKDYENREFDSFSEVLDAFFTAKDTALRTNAAAHDIIRLLNNIKQRTEKKLGIRLNELKSCENRERLRIYGELLKANLHLIKNGSNVARVPNYYDENMAEISIPLNPAISPAKNAERYFKEYKKTYTAQQALTVLTQKDREEIVYIDSVLDSISRCKTLAEISSIREELSNVGYIKKAPTKSRKKNASVSFTEEKSQEGYKILIGRNNIQNDYLTTKLASKNDMWFHVKNIPGSHVIVFCEGGAVSDETVLKAAKLAALNSKAANSTQVPVDYTYVKNVKKPSGSKPGMVIYTTNKTVYVDPKE